MFTHNMKMYRLLIGQSLHSMMQYRADFWTSLIGVFVLNGANIIQMSVVAWKFHALGTWTVSDLMILYGLFMISQSLYSIFFSRIPYIETEISVGSFDQYLTKPMSPFVQFIGGEIKYVGLCDTLMGIGLLILGKGLSSISWSAADLLYLLLFVICGGSINVCIRLIVSCTSFWVIKSNSLFSILTQFTLLTQKYPISIFGDVFKTFVTGVVPISFMNYYPAVFLLHKLDAPSWLCLLSPIIALVFVLLAAFVWTQGLRRYGSAGG